MRTAISVLPATCLLAAGAAAQQPVTLIVEGLDLPSLPGAVVTGIDSPAANGPGGYAVSVGVSGTTTGDVIWGSYDGTAPASVLATQGTYLGFDQGSFEFSVGVSAQGFVSYSSVLNPGSLDSVWTNDNLIVAKEGDAIPTLPGKVWRFASRPGFTDSAEPYFVGGIDDAGGADNGNGVFKGFVPVAVIKSGDVVPGLPLPLASGSSVDFDVRFSPDGTRYLLPVDLEGASAADDFALVLSGAGLTIGGTLVRELTLMPAALQVDPAEAWDNFDFMGLTDDGSYMFTGDTDGPIATDEIVVIDGQIALREGDVIAGQTLTGAIEGAAYSPIKDLSLTWDVVGSGGDLEAVLFNGRVVALEGDPADLDFDGIPEVGSSIVGFGGIAAHAQSGDRTIYLTADVDTLGTSSTTDDTEILLSIPVRDLEADGQAISVSTGGSVNFTLFTRRDVDVDFYYLLGSVSGTAPGIPIDGLVLPLNFDAYFSYTLANANSPLLPGSFGAPDALGVGDAALVIPAGTDPSLAGITVSHAYVTLGVSSVIAVTSISNAVDVTLLP
ncbi:hypothetical protein [Engelhardtia mirabilis]|uniref:Uncharacterized protein n=1 Tax=Engelhardtia mirabilis TaxID=2528011 RepID=A0A518BMV0_9BACT|nr:hypothetical protein Pla133_34080 [Planctomycetes bacterium Pla133]QDV02638.1 hypothetical protein Pla86_34070 [Planctomycetes bacterium Pla86]